MVSLQGSADIDEAELGRLAVAHSQIIDAVGRSLSIYEHYSTGGDTHSILTTTLNGAAHLRSYPQSMLRELLSIAYRQDGTRSRVLLEMTAAEFDRTLMGLIHGDAELRLLPAANAEIRAELEAVETLWTAIRPVLNDIAAGGHVDAQSIRLVSRVAGRMTGPLNSTSLMYENL